MLRKWPGSAGIPACTKKNISIISFSTGSNISSGYNNVKPILKASIYEKPALGLSYSLPPEKYAKATRGLLKGLWGDTSDKVEGYLERERNSWK